MKKAIAFALLLFLSRFGVSQSYNLRSYSIDEGLPQSQVHVILQGPKGFLWFGTDGGGLTKFDGKKFTSYTDMDGLANNLVYAIVIDKEEKFWIGTNKGLGVFQNDKFLNLPEALQALKTAAIRSLLIDEQKNIWIGTNDGVFVFDGKNLQHLKVAKGKSVVALYSDARNRIWIGTIGDGICCVENNREVAHFNTANGLNENTAYAFCKNPDGSLLVGTDFGLNIVKDNIVYPHPDPILSKKKLWTRCVKYDDAGTLWTCTWNDGVYKTTNGQTAHIGLTEGLEVNGVWCAVEDREKNIWLGTDGSGALKFGSQAITSMSTRNGLPSNMILSMCRARDGKIWYGHDNGLSLFDGKQYHFYDGNNGLATEKVWCIFEEDPFTTWIATYGSGLFKYSNGNFTLSPLNGKLSSKNIRCVKKDSKGRLWIGTAAGLNVIEGEKLTIYTTNEGLPSNRVLGVFEDSKGRIWLGTSGGGLCLVNEGSGNLSFTTFSEKNGLTDNVVLSITEDKAGNIWLATFGGIDCIDPVSGKIRKITRKDGLCSNTVYGISITNDGNVIICTNNGVDKLNTETYLKLNKVSARHFGKEEGFRGVECNTNSVFKDENGRIWIGTIKGVFIYDPSLDKLNHTEPLTHITGLRLFFEKFDYSRFRSGSSDSATVPGNMVFPYNENHLTFDFIGLSYGIPENVRYSYMLEGFDKQWTPNVSENFATYTNLQPGKYTFKVRACNNDGKWNTQPTVLTFTITPPFWKTWWFLGTAALLVTLGVYGFYRSRINRMERVQKLLEIQVDLKTREVREEKETVEQQKKLIEKKNHDITSSIRYAQRIQESILPLKEKLNDLWPESFIFYKPKDIVSGDFYWFTEQNGIKMVAAVDCTGHGVPGAFMSLIGNNLLNDIVKDKRLKDPARILEKLHEGLVRALKKSDHESDTVDGMDITLCVVDEEKHKLDISATGRPVLVVRNGEVLRFKLGKQPLGLVTKKQITFEKESISLQAGDTFYLYTDGYCDQFGAADDEKYLDARFEKLLLNLQNLPMREQEQQLEKEIDAWKGNLPQIDDMLVIGVRMK